MTALLSLNALSKNDQNDSKALEFEFLNNFEKDNDELRKVREFHRKSVLYHNINNGSPFIGPSQNCRLGQYCLYGIKRNLSKKIKKLVFKGRYKKYLNY